MTVGFILSPREGGTPENPNQTSALQEIVTITKILQTYEADRFTSCRPPSGSGLFRRAACLHPSESEQLDNRAPKVPESSMAWELP